jgi:AAA+ superfamily predicted ATPase
MQSKVFISYRRDDSSGHAGRVHDRLEREFGRNLLFMDVDAIPLGTNFVKVLSEEVAKCDVLLAIIGPGWLDASDSNGNRRLEDPQDFVRIEIATALKRGIPLVPILLEGTRPPKPDQLPADLKELALRNGLDVRHVSFHADMDKLIRALRSMEPAPTTPTASAHSTPANSEKIVVFGNGVAVTEAIEADLQNIVGFLRDPRKILVLGGKLPIGTLLVGPPGTGKTLIARAVAGEANVPIFPISGSQFVSARVVRDKFLQVKKNAPCIMFIDEIDALGRRGNVSASGRTEEHDQTLNQLFAEFDSLVADQPGVFVIAATNRRDLIDPALLRPGRFDRLITVPLPGVRVRKQILKLHLLRTPLAPDVDVAALARATDGFSGADLANLVNEGAILAARRSQRLVTQQEYEDALIKVKAMGAERRSLGL